MQQQSDDWFAARLGKVTASRVADVMATTKTGPAASRINYMMELLCQRLTGVKEEKFVSAEMLRGIEQEPNARSFYEADCGIMVMETGLVIHPTIKQFGASPDGLVGADGLLEIKCPNTATHVEFLRTGKPAGKYVWQMMAQMACTGRAWCDFVSYDDRMPVELQYHCVRLPRDDVKIAEMLGSITVFLKELDAIEREMRDRMKSLKAAA